MGTCICMAESFDCLPETITTLLTGYTPIQNKKFIKRKKKKKTKNLSKEFIDFLISRIRKKIQLKILILKANSSSPFFFFAQIRID